MYPTKWTGIHFTNITNETYMKIPPLEGYEYKLYGFEELVELLKKFNEYDSKDFINEYCRPLHIASNTKPVIAFQKNMYEEKSETNFSGERKVPVQVMIINNDRMKLKEYYEKVRLLTGDEIFITNSYVFGEQRDVKMKVGAFSSITDVRKLVDTNISNSIIQINSYLEKLKFPMNQSFIEGARKNLNLSYGNIFKGVAITMLITALETLLVKDNNIAKTLREYVPKFYCEITNDLKSIRNEISKLYKLRCDIVHKGLFRRGTEEDLLNLRRHVRKIILVLNEINLPKGEITKKLRNNQLSDILKHCEKFDFI